jgi:hypothetical protein
MKLSSKICYAFVALTLFIGVTSCSKEDTNDKYQDYPEKIQGMWLNFEGANKVFLEFYSDGTFKATENTNTLTITTGTYECKGDILTVQAAGQDGSVKIRTEQIRIEGSELRLINTGTGGTKLVLNRVKKEFSIQNKYNIFNVIPQLVSKDGDDAMLLPEGLTYNGQDRIPTSEMEGKALVESARKYFSEILFNGDGTLSHTFEGETLDKPYTFGNNKLTVTFQPGSKAYDIQADIFPNESEERLFIVIPNQRNWGAVFISLLKRENPGLTITDEQVEAMCDEQESTFETFTLILSYDKVK